MGLVLPENVSIETGYVDSKPFQILLLQADPAEHTYESLTFLHSLVKTFIIQICEHREK